MPQQPLDMVRQGDQGSQLEPAVVLQPLLGVAAVFARRALVGSQGAGSLGRLSTAMAEAMTWRKSVPHCRACVGKPMGKYQVQVL